MIVQEKIAKSILTKSNLPGCDYCINPYIGCGHKCAYCYAKFMAKYSNHTEPWGDFVDVKINAREILHRELNKKRRPTGEVLIGSVTDAYQPIENRYQVTRGILEELVNSDLTVSILTKSNLILRDIDIIKSKPDWSVGFSVTGLDEAIIKKIEPRTASIAKRIEALQEFHRKNIQTYVFIGPIIPGVCDYGKLLKLVSPYTDTVYGEMLNRRGDSIEQIKNILKQVDVVMFQEFIQSIMNEKYWNQIEKEFNTTCNEIGITNCTFIRH